MKQLDSLWVNNSQGRFGYSVQKKIYLRFGNSLDLDWEKGQWNENGYNKFVESVGWKEEGGEWMKYEELPMGLENPSSLKRGMLPLGQEFILIGTRAAVHFLFLQRLVDCSR